MLELIFYCEILAYHRYPILSMGMCTHMYIHVQTERNWIPSIYSFVHACTHGGSLIHSGAE